MINATIARRYFHGADPIGQRIRVGNTDEANPWRRIVGVVADEKTSSSYHQIGWIERPEVFEPLSQDPPPSVSVALRGSEAELQRVIADLGGDVALGDVETMQARLGRFLAYPRFRATLLAAFAMFAVLLASIGLYGVLRQFVARRTQEIGVRVAVGATPSDVLRLIAVQAVLPVGVGLTVGLLGAAALSRYLASLLYGVRPADPTTLAAVCVGLIAVAGIATFLPARRALRVDPIVALRNE
jgi:putative ABC transport system permease protein